ncbi:MAG TPA: acetolactate synthase large subunit, partial [Micrococcus luteus]|nr:acetolactate synthase large subunit [Micrococcus luteus]
MSTTPRDARAAVPPVPTPASRPTETALAQERRPAPRPEIVEPRVPGEGSRVEPTRMTGSQGIIRSLEELGVTDVFGLPGGAILPTYDPLMDSDQIRHILVRHEQGAG